MSDYRLGTPLPIEDGPRGYRLKPPRSATYALVSAMGTFRHLHDARRTAQAMCRASSSRVNRDTTTYPP